MNEDSWLVIAERLKFQERDIEAWKSTENPGEAMLNEWFLANNKLEATNGLVEVFRELGFVDYVELIEGYSKKVDRLSRQSSYDEETDVPHVFIACEKEDAERAQVLKKHLELLKLNIWIDESKLGPGVESSKSLTSRYDSLFNKGSL